MTVRELVGLLRKMDQDLPVRVVQPEDQVLANIEQVSYVEQENCVAVWQEGTWS